MSTIQASCAFVSAVVVRLHLHVSLASERKEPVLGGKLKTCLLPAQSVSLANPIIRDCTTQN